MIYRGYSLINLMVTMTISALLFLLIIQFYSQTERQNYRVLQRLQLQSELQRAIQLMAKDLKRAGFRAPKVAQNNLSLFEDENQKAIFLHQAAGELPNSCVLFFYDLDQNGCIGQGRVSNDRCVVDGRNSMNNIERELFGYALNNRMIKTRITYRNAVNAQCSSSECQRYSQAEYCNKGGWAELLDSAQYEITALRFTFIHNNGLEIYLRGHLKADPTLDYETLIVLPLLNQWTDL